MYRDLAGQVGMLLGSDERNYRALKDPSRAHFRPTFLPHNCNVWRRPLWALYMFSVAVDISLPLSKPLSTRRGK